HMARPGDFSQPLSTQHSALASVLRFPAGPAMMSVFRIDSFSAATPLIFAGVLLLILVVSFRSRAVVFCQYLRTMTGIELRPSDVRRVFRERGKDGVREF